MKKILVSVLIVGALLAVISGATMAYFTSDVSSTNNTFAAGTMTFTIKDPSTTGHQVFDVSGLKPGQTVTRYMAVANDSTQDMDMKWEAWISGSGDLGNVLKAKVTHNPAGYDYTSLLTGGYTIPGPEELMCDFTPISSLGSGNTTLTWESPKAPAFQPKQAAVYKLEVKMDENAGDAYQGKTFTGAINFHATQYENPNW